MKIIDTELAGVRIIEPDVFPDDRGFFLETYHKERYNAFGIRTDFVQDNLSYSIKGTLRGIHFQHPHAQAKLVYVIAGEIFDVAVDVRKDSSTFGKWEGIILSGENHRQMYIPQGFGHGFCVLSDTVYFSYKCSDFYTPEDEGGILWSDPEIAIQWPVMNPIISEKDKKLPLLKEINPASLPRIGKGS
jgi:dTDP-4-dehydrorhamnose 3,5-epimerase